MSSNHGQHTTTTTTTSLQVAPKSMVVAYVLWFFLGQLGVHRFYLGKTTTGIVQAALTVIGWLTVIMFIGWAFLAVLWIWLIVDLFLIPGMSNGAGIGTAITTTTVTVAPTPSVPSSDESNND